jgi:hypothetical protein
MITTIDPVEAVGDWVNLDNYTSSRAFLGFFHRRNAFQTGLPERAVDLLSKTLGMPDVLMTSLFLPANEEWLRADYSLTEFELQQFRELVDYGVVRKIDFNDWGTDYESEDWAIGLRAACGSFARISPVLPAQFLAVAEAMMVLPGLKGHLFAWYSKHSLLAYPHDETGFGFMGTAPAEHQTLALLEQAFTTADFSFSVPL